MKTKILLLNLLTMFVNFSLFAQPGTLDATFGTGGKVITDIFSGSNDVVNSMAIQTDGKIVVVGLEGFGAYFLVVRYNSDGSLDSTFDSDGIVRTDITVDNGMNGENSYSVAIQNNGKIIVVGYSNDGTGVTGADFTVVRYNSDGSLDNTFSSDGKVVTDIWSNSSDVANTVAVQSDGKIVVGGKSQIGANNSISLVRYNSNGSLDNTFDSDGVVFDYGYITGLETYSLAIQSDGKIVMVGEEDNGGPTVIVLIRRNSDGSRDTSFSGGMVTTSVGISSVAYSVAIQSDGKIIVGGYSTNGSYSDFVLLRYNTDGSLDNTFGSAGLVTTDFGNNKNDYGYSVAILDIPM